LDWNAELEFIRRFSPDYHIPTDYSVYQSMTESEQAQAIDNCMDGTEWIATRLKNHATTVLVQAKGWLPRHYERCQSTMKRLHHEFVVFYAAGYKARVHELNEDLKTLVSVLNPTGILLIGKQSVRFLRQTIPEVVAAAGGRWRRQSGLHDNEHSSQKHREWKQEVEQHLGSGQATIDSYTTSRVKENG
ncbi:MAG: hypothetical protein ABEI52_06290, partial [Halobacteriaceae archaeon]